MIYERCNHASTIVYEEKKPTLNQIHVESNFTDIIKSFCNKIPPEVVSYKKKLLQKPVIDQWQLMFTTCLLTVNNQILNVYVFQPSYTKQISFSQSKELSV